MAQERLTEGALLFPGMATPEGAAPPGGYRIQRAIDAGGFGITYEAVKREGNDPAHDITASLWLPPNVPIVIKEYFPDFAARRGRTISIDGEEEDHEEVFNRALQRFQREAERLCYLTCLRALRAGRAALDGNSGVLGQRIDAEIAAGGTGDTDPGRAMQLVARLGGEARAAAQQALGRSTLPIVYDFFAADNNAYYVMEFLGGGTLKGRLNEDRRRNGTTRVDVAGSSYQLRQPWAPDRLRRFAASALNALEELHNGIPGQQLVHCDLKPGNIMFRAAGSDDPVLIDFGLARNVNDGKSRSLIAGTTGFAPLEIDPHTRAQYDDGRFGGANVGPWTDIYSMAAIFRMLATGVEGSRLPAVFERIRTMPGEVDPIDRLPPYPADFPGQMAEAIRRGMNLYKEDRPQSVAQWRHELGLAGAIPPAIESNPPPRWGAEETVLAGDATQRQASTASTGRGNTEPTQWLSDRPEPQQAWADPDPPSPSEAPAPSGTGGGLAWALVGVLVAAGLIAGLLFATDMFGDKPKSASDPAPAVATPKLAPSPSPVVKTPDPAPVETPVPEPSATPTPSYQFIRLGISIERLSQSEIDDLLLAGVKVNDGVRVTASAGRVPGLSPGTALVSDCNGGPARGLLFNLDAGESVCLATPAGNRNFDPPR